LEHQILTIKWSAESEIRRKSGVVSADTHGIFDARVHNLLAVVRSTLWPKITYFWKLSSLILATMNSEGVFKKIKSSQNLYFFLDID
jgi:hypothetical protein